MPFKRKPFFADHQIKRYLVQIMSCFSGYQAQTGLQRDGKVRYMDVPIIYGDISRTAGFILRGGGENMMSYLPTMSCYMTRLKRNVGQSRATQHREKIQIWKDKLDADGVVIPGIPGQRVIVERYMPKPYDMEFSISIWASRNDQGYQLIEQLLTVFDPTIDIQLSNSPTDWTFLTSLIWNGDVNFERVVPGGAESTTDGNFYVYTMPFKTFLWLSPPAKVYKATPIYEIHVPILEIEAGLDFDTFTELDGLVIRADEQDIIKFESFK